MRPRLALLAAAATLATAASADASTYCVHQPGTPCPAGIVIDEKSDLQKALDDAAKSNDADAVKIGAGTWSGRFHYGGAGELDIAGAGTDKTTLTSSGAAGTVLDAGAAHVVNLRVGIPAANDWTGISAGDGSLVTDVVVGVADPTATGLYGLTGVELHGDADLLDAKIDVPSEGVKDTAVATDGNGDHLIAASSLSGELPVYALNSAAGATHVSRSTLTGDYGFYVYGTRGYIDNSVIRASGLSPLHAGCYPGKSASLEADHVTLTGPSTYPIRSWCDSPGLTSDLKLTNSISTLSASYHRYAANKGTANLTVAYSDVRGDAAQASGPGATTVTDTIDVDPGFAYGTLQPRAGSPVIDAGSPAKPNEAKDLLGADRQIGARQDMGAYEFDPAHPPVALPKPGGKDPAPPPATGPADQPPPPPPCGATAPSGDPSAPSTPAEITDAQLLAFLRATLETRKGRTYKPAFPVGGTLRITWKRGRKVLARGKLVRTAAGPAKLRVKLTKAGRKRKRARVKAIATFVRTGRPALKAARRGRVRLG